jgi:hypothetical protein
MVQHRPRPDINRRGPCRRVYGHRDDCGPGRRRQPICTGATSSGHPHVSTGPGSARSAERQPDHAGAGAPIDDYDQGADDPDRSADEAVHSSARQCAEHCPDAELSGPGHELGSHQHDPSGALTERHSNSKRS